MQPAENGAIRATLGSVNSSTWNELDPSLLDVIARLADILPRADHDALSAYLAATAPATCPVEDQVAVMSRAAYDLDTLGFLASMWPFAP